MADLPQEIIIEIFSHLDPEKDRRTLHSLCRASRTFNEIAQPFLFQTFSRVNRSQIVDYAALAVFTRTIWNRPDLRKNVRRIIYRDTENLDTYYYPLWEEAHQAPTVDALREAIHALNIPEWIRQVCFMGIVNQDIHAPLRILFANLLNLQELGMVICQEKSFGTGLLFESLNKSTMNLRKVELKVEPESDWGIPITDVVPMMSLPKLEYFAMENCTADWNTVTAAPLSQNSINASTLKLHGSALDLWAMNSIMAACKWLESLTYTCRPVLTEQVEQLPLNATQLMMAVMPHKDTLKSLHVRFKDLDIELYDLQNRTRFESLRPLSALKHLTVEMSCLMEFPKLPGMLETLELENCQESIEEFVDYLVQENVRSVPYLRKVLIHPSHSPCAKVVGIDRPMPKEIYRNSSEARETFQSAVQDLEEVARFGYFEFEVKCNFYQAAKRAIAGKAK